MSWRLARSLDTARSEILELWPETTIWTIGDDAHCPGTSDHCPNGAGVVRAIDVVGQEQADYLWTRLQELRDPRTKYLIHDSWIVNRTVSPWVVRRYSGSNPHEGHIHISVSNRATAYDDPAPWGIAQDQPDEPEPQEDDMPLTDADLDRVRQVVRDEIRQVIPANLESEMDRLRVGQRAALGPRVIQPVDLGDDGP